MNENFIPMFKKSGDGVARDVLKLKKLEAISEGWYRGQLISILEKVAGKVVIDGVECYNTNISINGYTSVSNLSEYAKNIRKLLKLFGMTDSALADIYNTWSNNEIDGILLNFDKAQTTDKIYTLDDFKKAIKEVKSNLVDVSKIEIIHTNKTYDKTETSRPCVAMQDIYSGDLWKIDNDYFGDLQEYQAETTEEGSIIIPIPIVRNFQIGQALHFTQIKIYNSLEEDITNTFNSVLLKCIETLVAFSGNSLFERVELTKISETLVTGVDSEYYIIETKEVYNTIFNNEFYDSQFERYRQKDSIPSKYYENESYFINGIIANHLWEYYEFYQYYDNDKTNDLFYIKKSRSNILEPESYSRYITVEGLKHSKTEDIAREIAKYADFQYIIPRKKKKFLGIGGLIGSFLGGIFEGILKIVSAISGLLYYIPPFRVSVQFIGWLFSGKWSNDKERFKMITTRILLAVVAVLIVILTGGAGWQIAMSLVMSAYSMYTGIKEFDDIVEFANNQAQYKYTKESDNKLNEKLIDLSNSEAMADAKKQAMYRPFDTINKTYASPFDGNSVYNPNFGL